MLLKQSQRYQKTHNLSAGRENLWRRAGLGLALCLGLLGCNGTKAPAAATQAQATPLTADPSANFQANVQPPVATQGVISPIPAHEAEEALIAAREAMQKKQWHALAALVPDAQHAPLVGSYARYWWLRQQVQDPTQPIPVAELQQFMAVNQDEYLADRVKADWIVAAARAGDFAQVNRLGNVINSNANVDCSQVLARHMTGQKVSSEEAMKAFRPATVCWSMLDELVESGVVGWKPIQTQLRELLESNKTGDAQRMAALLFSAGQMKSYAALMKNPRAWLSGQTAPSTREQTELVTIALARLARSKDRDEAASYVESRWGSALPREAMQWVWGQFGLAAALNVDPTAVRFYRRSGTAPMTDYNHAWEVRSELRQSPIDWRRVEQAILKMSAEQQAETVWVYWRGRALAAQGDKTTAQRYFASIQKEMDFYGQLANEELGRSPYLPPPPPALTEADLAQARANIGLQRAVKLFDLGWRAEAVPEWNFALKGMNDRQLRAAAEFAREQAIYDRVINTSLLTRSEIDLTQRFIAPFEGRVSEKARLINLDPAWVYGLIRQESRFIMRARSRVGASGLMQLMPATAKWVANKIGMKDFTPSSVNDFDTNTVLGTQYLNMVLDQLDGSQVLATAGYNAGPGRPIRWRAQLQAPVEGAIFAETIPFTETRLYVKHVMSNAVYYASLFSGQPQSLKSRLGIVAPRATRQVALP